MILSSRKEDALLDAVNRIHADAPLPNDTNKVSYLPTDERGVREQHDIDEREAERAVADVRRQEHSAD